MRLQIMPQLNDELFKILTSEDKSEDKQAEKRAKVRAILVADQRLSRIKRVQPHQRLKVTDTNYCDVEDASSPAKKFRVLLDAPAVSVLKTNDLELLKILLGGGFEPNQALWVAIIRGQIPSIRYLLTQNADVNHVIGHIKEEDNTPFKMAAGKHYIRNILQSSIHLTKALELYVSIFSRPDPFAVVETKDQEEAFSLGLYARALANFNAACSHEYTCTFVVDYLAARLEKTSNELELGAIKIFTEEAFRLFSNTTSSHLKLHEYFCEYLLKKWEKYSPMVKRLFPTREELTAFLKPLYWVKQPEHNAVLSSSVIPQQGSDPRPMPTPDAKDASSPSTLIPPIADNLLALTKSSSPVNSAPATSPVTAAVAPTDSNLARQNPELRA